MTKAEKRKTILTDKSQKDKLRTLGARRFFRRYFLPTLSRKKESRPHKRCPICGKTRRAGYFESCRDCRPLFEVRESITRVIMQLGAIAQDKGYRLNYDFCGAYITIRARTTKAVQVMDGFGEPIPKGKCYAMEANARMSLRDIYVSRQNLKHVVMCAVLELFERLERKARESIDCKGRVVEVAGMVVPCAGSWNLNASFKRR